MGTASTAPTTCTTEEEVQLSDDARGPGGASSRDLSAYKSTLLHLNSCGLKATLGILTVAAAQWKQELKPQQMSAANPAQPCRTSPLDQLAALVLHGQRRRCQISQAPCPPPDVEHSSTKPQNSKRIVVLGAPGVGKTSILRRYLSDEFEDEYNPTSEDFLRKLFRIRGKSYQIDILDASRERDFPAKRRLSILTGDIFLLVFSLDDRNSFEEVCALRAEILAAKSKLSRTRPRVPLVVCANKADLPASKRAVSTAEVLEALRDDCAYFETSAKDSTNLDHVFETLAKRGGLPAETGPSRHRKVSLKSYQASRNGRTAGWAGARTPEGEDACGTLFPQARRPSFGSDLRQVIEPHASKKTRKRREKCWIQ